MANIDPSEIEPAPIFSVLLPVSGQPVFSLSAVRSLLKSGVPDWAWLLARIQSEHGWLRFPTFLSNAITNLKAHDYPLLYESDYRLASCSLRAFMSPEEIKDFSVMLESADIEKRNEILESIDKGSDEAFAYTDTYQFRRDVVAARREFPRLSLEDQREIIVRAKCLIGATVATFYQSLSMMLHGERLTSLVARAKAGQSDAFVKAVRTDHRILPAIPYFRDTYANARDTGKIEFVRAVDAVRNKAPFKGKIQHKELWMAFSMLDLTGWLRQLSDPELLKICDEARVGYGTRAVSDVNSLGKCRRQYLEFQNRAFLSTQ